MIKQLILIIGSIYIDTSYSLSQKIKALIPNEVGINIFTQYTQTTMHSEVIAPFYNTYGFSKGIGLNAEYKMNRKLRLKLFYHYTELMNTYNIYRYHAAFAAKDIEKNKRFSYYWTSHEIGVGLKYLLFSKKNFSIYLDQSVCTNYGQLLFEHYPSVIFTDDTIKRKIYYQDGLEATLSYKIYPTSVRNMGFNMLNGLIYSQKINSKFKFNCSFTINYGFVPLIGTRIEYRIKSPERYNTQVGDHSALSNNSGIRLGLGVNYILKN